MAKKPTLMTHKRNGSFVPGHVDNNLIQSQDFANTQAFGSVRAGVTKPFDQSEMNMSTTSGITPGMSKPKMRVASNTRVRKGGSIGR
jgi:hypothetical protein